MKMKKLVLLLGVLMLMLAVVGCKQVNVDLELNKDNTGSMTVTSAVMTALFSDDKIEKNTSLVFLEETPADVKVEPVEYVSNGFDGFGPSEETFKGKKGTVTFNDFNTFVGTYKNEEFKIVDLANGNKRLEITVEGDPNPLEAGGTIEDVYSSMKGLDGRAYFNIKTDYNIVNHNATKVENGVYTWDLVEIMLAEQRIHGTTTLFIEYTEGQAPVKEQPQTGLTDIANHWGKDYITYLVGKGAIAGYPDGTFKPDKAISNAEFITIVNKIIEEKLESDPSLLTYFMFGVNPDTLGDPNYKSKHWASEVHAFMYRAGLVGEEDFSREELDEPITRYTMAKILVGMLEKFKEAYTQTAGIASIMSDYETVHYNNEYSYFAEQAFMKGIISGKTSNGLFDGKASGTRAEAATMIVRAIDKSKRKEVVIKTEIPRTITAIDESDSTVNEVLNFDWENKGVVQIKERNRQFGICNGILTIEGSTNSEYQYTKAVENFTIEEWLALPDFTYKGIKYETVEGDYYKDWLSRKTPLRIYLADPHRPLIPIEDDTIVDIAGKSITLKQHKETGVLGYGQKIDFYSGIIFANGHVFKQDDLGSRSLGYLGQTYLVDQRTGTGYFRDDWKKIQGYELDKALAIKNPTEGQIVGQWTEYYNNDWRWIGPTNN